MNFEQPYVSFNEDLGLDFHWYGENERLCVGYDPEEGWFWFWITKIELWPADYNTGSGRYRGDFKTEEDFRNFLECLKRFPAKDQD